MLVSRVCARLVVVRRLEQVFSSRLRIAVQSVLFHFTETARFSALRNAVKEHVHDNTGNKNCGSA
jgi:hypothetical protein